MRGATRRSIPSMQESMFQSTRPMRGATVAHPVQSSPAWFQSTRPMRGATLCDLSLLGCGGVSIHAPHAGRDRRVLRGSSRQRRFNPRAPCGARLNLHLPRCFACKFQSTRPMRGATVRVRDCRLLDGVSIHAPHAGRDVATLGEIIRQGRVSIHAPHAGRD